MYTGVVYLYTSPSGKHYVGQTTNEKQRRRAFLNKGEYSDYGINNARNKYGPENFTYKVLKQFTTETKEELLGLLYESEKRNIQKYDSVENVYNETYEGNFRNGEIATECIERMRKSLKEYHKTHENSFKGKHHTEENKQHISACMKEYYKTHDSPYKGCHPSEEQRKAISDQMKLRTGDKNAFYGKHHSEKTKQTIRDANSIPVVQLNKDTLEFIREFPSAISAARYYGKERSDIIKVCKGTYRVKTVFGSKWMYKSDYLKMISEQAIQ